VLENIPILNNKNAKRIKPIKITNTIALAVFIFFVLKYQRIRSMAGIKENINILGSSLKPFENIAKPKSNIPAVIRVETIPINAPKK